MKIRHTKKFSIPAKPPRPTSQDTHPYPVGSCLPYNPTYPTTDPEPGTGNREPEPRTPNPETRNPKPETSTTRPPPPSLVPYPFPTWLTSAGVWTWMPVFRHRNAMQAPPGVVEAIASMLPGRRRSDQDRFESKRDGFDAECPVLCCDCRCPEPMTQQLIRDQRWTHQTDWTDRLWFRMSTASTDTLPP
jgi:hypothetical protein